MKSTEPKQTERADRQPAIAAPEPKRAAVMRVRTGLRMGDDNLGGLYDSPSNTPLSGQSHDGGCGQGAARTRRPRLACRHEELRPNRAQGLARGALARPRRGRRLEAPSAR